ncbi:MAG TPA: hypothetical protein VK658_19540 [Chryseolinea sp.]|nr:hypothetical protein [Chryseolinea sp.]
MKVIVLGSAGQIGSIVLDALNPHHQVTGTSRRASEKHLLFNPFSDDWSRLGKADVLINCVGQIAPTRSSSFYDIHVGLIKLIIKNREKIGQPRIVNISALGATPHHRVAFLRTKGIGDDLLLQCSDTIVLRPSIVCTHRTMLVRKMLLLAKVARYSGGVIFVPEGFLKTKIQPVMPIDLINTIEIVLHTIVERIVNVVGREAISFSDILTDMFEKANQKPRIIQIPRMLTDIVVKTAIAHVFPQLINSQQYQLLFEDNTADPGPVQKLLKRSLMSTSGFFKHEFSYAAH